MQAYPTGVLLGYHQAVHQGRNHPKEVEKTVFTQGVRVHTHGEKESGDPPLTGSLRSGTDQMS